MLVASGWLVQTGTIEAEEPSDLLMVPGHLQAPELPHCFSTLSTLPLLSLGMAEAGNG